MENYVPLKNLCESGNPELLEKPGFSVALRSEHHAVQGFACEAWSVGMMEPVDLF
jgi:hypothetical protein